MVGLGFREAEDRSSIQLESLFIVQVRPSDAIGPALQLSIPPAPACLANLHVRSSRLWPGRAAGQQP